MARLIEDTFGAGLETVRLLVTNDRCTAELGVEIRKKGGVKRALDALHREFFPEEAKPAEPAPVPEPVRWERVDENTLRVFNNVPSKLPFNTAERTWNVITPGTVIFTKQGMGKDQILLRNGVLFTPHVEEVQKAKNGIMGQILWDTKLKGMSGHGSNNELDALHANPDFIPESWQGLAIFFWGEGFRCPGDTHEYVCYLSWGGQRWCVYYDWLGSQWRGSYPAAVSASPAL